MPLYYVEVALHANGDADVAVMCDEPSQQNDAEAAQALLEAAATLRERAATQLH